MAELYPYPRFSLAERDRRWRTVRELMRQQNLDVVVTPQNSGHSADYQANTRYLTHCGGGEPDLAAVFPLEGAVTAIATSAGPRWPTVQDWVTDVREARRNYGKVIVERLKELGVDHGRVGITGLGEVDAHAGRDDLLRHLEADSRSLSQCTTCRRHRNPRRSALCQKSGRDRRACEIDGDQ